MFFSFDPSKKALWFCVIYSVICTVILGLVKLLYMSCLYRIYVVFKSYKRHHKTFQNKTMASV